MLIFRTLFPKSRAEPTEQAQTDDGRVQIKITNTAPPEEAEPTDAILPPQPTLDINTYLKTTQRVKKDNDDDNG